MQTQSPKKPVVAISMLMTLSRSKPHNRGQTSFTAAFVSPRLRSWESTGYTSPLEHCSANKTALLTLANATKRFLCKRQYIVFCRSEGIRFCYSHPQERGVSLLYPMEGTFFCHSCTRTLIPTLYPQSRTLIFMPVLLYPCSLPRGGNFSITLVPSKWMYEYLYHHYTKG